MQSEQLEDRAFRRGRLSCVNLKEGGIRSVSNSPIRVSRRDTFESAPGSGDARTVVVVGSTDAPTQEIEETLFHAGWIVIPEAADSR